MKRTEERTEKGPFFQVHPNPPPVKANSGAKEIKVLTQTCSQGQLKALRNSAKGSGSEEKYYHGKARQESRLGYQETRIRQPVTEAARRTPGLQTLFSSPL